MQVWKELAEGRCGDGLTPEPMLQETRPHLSSPSSTKLPHSASLITKTLSNTVTALLQAEQLHLLLCSLPQLQVQDKTSLPADCNTGAQHEEPAKGPSVCVLMPMYVQELNINAQNTKFLNTYSYFRYGNNETIVLQPQVNVYTITSSLT